MTTHSITVMESPVKPLAWRSVKPISSRQFIQLLVTHHLHGQVRTVVEEAEIQLSVPPAYSLGYRRSQRLWLRLDGPAEAHSVSKGVCRDKIRSAKGRSDTLPTPSLVPDCISTWVVGTDWPVRTQVLSLQQSCVGGHTVRHTALSSNNLPLIFRDSRRW